MGGVYIDGNGLGVGLQILAEAIRDRRERKQLEKVQLTTSLFQELTDPNTSVERRNAIKQRMGDVLDLDDGQVLPDDPTEMSYFLDQYGKQKWGRALKDSVNRNMWDAAFDAGRKNDKLLDVNQAIEQNLKSLNVSPQEMDTFKLLVEAGAYEAANNYGASRIEEFNTKWGGVYSDNQLLKDPTYLENEKMKFNQKMFEEEALAVMRYEVGETYGKKYGGSGSRRTSGGWGTGGGSGGYDPFTDPGEYAKWMGTRLKDTEDIIKTANGDLDTIMTKQNDIRADLSKAGIDINDLANTTVFRVEQDDGSKVNISKMMVLDVLMTHKFNGEKAYEDFASIYPDVTPEQFDAVASELAGYDGSQKGVIAQYMRLEAEKDMALEQLNYGQFQLSQVHGVLQDPPPGNVNQEVWMNLGAKSTSLQNIMSTAQSVDPLVQDSQHYTPATSGETSNTSGNIADNILRGIATSWESAKKWAEEKQFPGTGRSVSEEVDTATKNWTDWFKYGGQVLEDTDFTGSTAAYKALTGTTERPPEKSRMAKQAVAEAEKYLEDFTWEEIYSSFKSKGAFVRGVTAAGVELTKEEREYLYELYDKKRKGYVGPGRYTVQKKLEEIQRDQ